MQELSWTFTWAQRPSEVVVERAPALAKGKRGKWCAAQTQESEWFASGVERFDKFKGCLAVVCSWGAPLRSTASSQRPCRIPRVASVAKPLLRSATPRLGHFDACRASNRSSGLCQVPFEAVSSQATRLSLKAELDIF